MAFSSEAREILQLEVGRPEREFVTEESMNGLKKKVRKPEDMPREVWNLVQGQSKDIHQITPSDFGPGYGQVKTLGYKQEKAKLGSGRVRPWRWMPFTNPARLDGAVFHHWRRAEDEGKDYPFARFNKKVKVPTYSDLEYHQHLRDDGWSRQETDHLFDLCRRFDLRFIVMQDRWDSNSYGERSVEDLKERYYNVCEALAKARAPPGFEPKNKYDAEHERLRKVQLTKLLERTPEQVEEEAYLVSELKRMKARKKFRGKKTQDTANSNIDSQRAGRRTTKKIFNLRHKNNTRGPSASAIEFPDFQQPGVSLRSHRMFPAFFDKKKPKAIEQVMKKCGVELPPPPTEEIVTHFNKLARGISRLFLLRKGLKESEADLQAQRRFSQSGPKTAAGSCVSTTRDCSSGDGFRSSRTSLEDSQDSLDQQRPLDSLDVGTSGALRQRRNRKRINYADMVNNKE